MFEDNELERENADWRIREHGVGAELIRQRELCDLKTAMEAFYAHIAMVDITALKMALQILDLGVQSGGSATLVDAFWKIFQEQLASECKDSLSGSGSIGLDIPTLSRVAQPSSP